MRLLIIDNAAPEDAYFNQPLTNAVAHLTNCDTINYLDVDTISISNYSGIIMSGAPLHYSFESIVGRDKKLAWIHDIPLPVLGICFGHQIIGNLFGTEVFEEVEAEDGFHPITVVKSDPLLRGLEPTFTARTLHRGSIAVPFGFTLLASSAQCKNQVMKHDSKTMYGCQFHPELSDDGKTLLSNFVAIVAAL